MKYKDFENKMRTVSIGRMDFFTSVGNGAGMLAWVMFIGIAGTMGFLGTNHLILGGVALAVAVVAAVIDSYGNPWM